MQETRVPSLVWEDSTCRGATKPLCHNYWSPWGLEPMLHNRRSHCSEKPEHHNQRVAPARHNYRKATGAMKAQCSSKQNKAGGGSGLQLLYLQGQCQKWLIAGQSHRSYRPLVPHGIFSPDLQRRHAVSPGWGGGLSVAPPGHFSGHVHTLQVAAAAAKSLH